MKKWNKSTFVWLPENCPKELRQDSFLTNIPIASVPEMQRLKSCKMIRLSIDQGKQCAEAFLVFRNPINPANTQLLYETDMEAIRKRLSRLKADFDFTIFDQATDDTFQMRMNLASDTNFCLLAITFARKLFRVLGIEDPRGWKLASFSLTQETYIKVGKEEECVPFSSYLKRTFGLPEPP